MLTALVLIGLMGSPTHTFTLYIYSVEDVKIGTWYRLLSKVKESIPTLEECIDQGEQEKEFYEALGLKEGEQITFKCISN